MRQMKSNTGRRKVGCITKAGLILLPLLLVTLVLQRIWGDLQTPEGQRNWLGKLLGTLRSENTYVLLGVFAFNVWLYTRLTNWLYPTSGLVVRGVALAASAVKADDSNSSGDRDAGAGWGHFFLIVVLPFLFFAAGRSEYRLIQKFLHPPARTVRVAAIQCGSIMGDTAGNIDNLVALIRQAARNGAKIVVTPECAVQGYLHAPSWTSWTSETNKEFSVSRVAEAVPGPSTELFSALAKELHLFLCIGMIEGAEGRFFNAQVLFAPDGGRIAHHRKKALWTPGDSLWCSEGDLPVQVVDSPYGRLGMMICYDFHVMPERLAEQKADIVLYSVGWYGPNEKSWFSKQFPQKAVVPYGFSVVAANWSGVTEADEWPGRGYSSVIAGDGTVLAMAKSVFGNEVVWADLPLKKRAVPARSAHRWPETRVESRLNTLVE